MNLRQIKQLHPLALLVLVVLSCKQAISFVDPCTGEMVKGHEVGEYKRGSRSFVRVRYQTRDYYFEEQNVRPIGFMCEDLPGFSKREFDSPWYPLYTDSLPDSLKDKNSN